MYREQAEKLLEQLLAQRPEKLESRLSEQQRGIGFVLAYLDCHDPVYAGDLAREMHVSSARIARLLNAMEKRHLIERKQDNKDKRKIRVVLTPEGILAVRAHYEEILSLIEILIEQVGLEELQEFLRLCQRIKQALEESDWASKESCFPQNE